MEGISAWIGPSFDGSGGGETESMNSLFGRGSTSRTRSPTQSRILGDILQILTNVSDIQRFRNVRTSWAITRAIIH